MEISIFINDLSGHSLFWGPYGIPRYDTLGHKGGALVLAAKIRKAARTSLVEEQTEVKQ